MGATVAFAESEMRSVAVSDALFDLVAVSARKLGVFLIGILVYVDLPTDTAAVSATVGNAYESFVVFWREKLHFFSF